MEGLRKESLDLTSSGNSELVFRREFVHTQNRDNVAEFFVTLQSGLNTTCDRVVLFTDDVRVNLTRSGVKRVNSRINTESCNITRQHNCGVQVAECCSRRRVSQVVSRNVNGLNGGNGTDLRRSNTFLELTHFFSQCRLIAHSGGHTA